MDNRIVTMLSRHASSLYWLGRYQERTEYLARYLEVKYFSTLDNSIPEYSDISLRSILFMFSGEVPDKKQYKESDVIWDVALNANSKTSILGYVNTVRENTKGVRNLISNELWESINKNYHFISNFDSKHIKTRGLFEFTNGVQENADVFNAKLDSTMLHDNTRAFIKLGIYLERAYQIVRGIINTLIDIKALDSGSKKIKVDNYLWMVNLNVLEAADMSRKIFKASHNKDNTCEFLICNPLFPKSLSFCFSKIDEIIQKIKNTPDHLYSNKDSLEFKVAKIANHLKYSDYSEIKDSLDTFLDFVLKEVLVLNDRIHDEFFDYKH